MSEIEEIKRDVDKDIAQIVHEQEGKKLKINEDTEYSILYDIYNTEDEKYFYIKMIETTVDAPFYYIRSYKIDELQQLNKIFKVFDNENFEEIKKYMNTLFDKNKISLSFDQDENIIKMELEVVLFAKQDKITFILYREMIPNDEKDSKLLSLYSSEKNKNKLIKEISSLIYNFKGNLNKEIINNLKKILKSKEIPGIEDELINEIKNENEPIKEDKKDKEIIIEKKEQNQIIEVDEDINNSDLNPKVEIAKKDSITSKIFVNVQKRYVFSFSKNPKDYFSCILTVKNIFEDAWPQGSLKLVCNKELSTLKYSDIKDFEFEIGPDQDGDFEVLFEKKDLNKGKFKCYIQLLVNGKKITDSDVILNIKVKD